MKPSYLGIVAALSVALFFSCAGAPAPASRDGGVSPASLSVSPLSKAEEAKFNAGVANPFVAWDPILFRSPVRFQAFSIVNPTGRTMRVELLSVAIEGGGSDQPGKLLFRPELLSYWAERSIDDPVDKAIKRTLEQRALPGPSCEIKGGDRPFVFVVAIDRLLPPSQNWSLVLLVDGVETAFSGSY